MFTQDTIKQLTHSFSMLQAMRGRIDTVKRLYPYPTGPMRPGWHSEERILKAQEKRAKRLERNKQRYAIQEQEAYVRAVQNRAVMEEIKDQPLSMCRLNAGKTGAVYVKDEFEAGGKPKAIVVCPNCEKELEVFVNSMAGSGKKCSCGTKIKKEKGENKYYVEGV